MPIPQYILEKLEKLLALRDGAEKIGSLQEAEVAAQKISELLAKWNVELSTLNFEKDQYSHIVFEVLSYNKREAEWIHSLYSTLGKHNFVRVIGRKSLEVSDEVKWLSLIGKPHNIEIVQYLAIQFENKIRHLEKIAWNSIGQNSGTKRNTFKRGFFRGAIGGLAVKLKEQAEHNSAHIPTFGTLVRQENLTLEQKVQDLFNNNIKSNGQKHLKGTGGIVAGYNSGKNLDLNQGLKKSAFNNKLIN